MFNAYYVNTVYQFNITNVIPNQKYVSREPDRYSLMRPSGNLAQRLEECYYCVDVSVPPKIQPM